MNIIFSEKKGAGGDIGEIILNRPKVLNTLTLEMCRDLGNQLDQWANAEHIKAVIIKGAGDRAFCAGGDIRVLYDNRALDLAQKSQFFWHEYRLNRVIHHFPKPYISFLDGITMGGGAGVSLHGSHQIGTENLKFAMPETKIGFHPDIGASHFLNHCPGKIGRYLGLTGVTIDFHQAHAFGLITQIVLSDQLEKVEDALLNTEFKSDDHQTINMLIGQFTAPPKPPKNDCKIIDECFNQSSVEAIIDALQHSSQQDCAQIANDLETRAPTALKVTLEQLNRAENMNFDDIMQMDFDITQHCLEHHDFYEGIRATVIDKDRQPNWKPNTLSEINNNDIETYFKPTDFSLNRSMSD